MKVLIDNGHGSDTAGKCSPDGRLLEYRYAREIAAEVVAGLRISGVDASLIVPESVDISLSERARRVNKICGEVGAGNVCLVSIHINAAASDSHWHNATGWEAYTSPGPTRADLLAESLYEVAREMLPQALQDHDSKRLIRTDYSDGDSDKEASFAILRLTRCPACLTENFFQDNEADVNWLLSEKGRRIITYLHVEGIKRYISKL